MLPFGQEPQTVKERVELLLQVYAGWQDHGSDPTYAMVECRNGDCYCKLPEKLIAVINQEARLRFGSITACPHEIPS